MCQDPIYGRGQALNRHRWPWVEPCLITAAVLACADEHGAAEPGAQSACDVGLSIVADRQRCQEDVSQSFSVGYSVRASDLNKLAA